MEDQESKVESTLTGVTNWDESTRRRIFARSSMAPATSIFSRPEFEGRPFEGCNLRLFDPKTSLWTIYWADSSGVNWTAGKSARSTVTRRVLRARCLRRQKRYREFLGLSENPKLQCGVRRSRSTKADRGEWELVCLFLHEVVSAATNAHLREL